MADKDLIAEPAPATPAAVTTPTTVTAPETDIAEKLEDRRTVTDEQAAARLEADKAAEAEPQPIAEPAEDDGVEHTEPVRTLAAGTVISIGNYQVKLKEPAVIEYFGTEQAFAGMLAVSDNLDINRPLLEGKYDSFGSEVK